MGGPSRLRACAISRPIRETSPLSLTGPGMAVEAVTVPLVAVTTFDAAGEGFAAAVLRSVWVDWLELVFSLGGWAGSRQAVAFGWPDL